MMAAAAKGLYSDSKARALELDYHHTRLLMKNDSSPNVSLAREPMQKLA